MSRRPIPTSIPTWLARLAVPAALALAAAALGVLAPSLPGGIDAPPVRAADGGCAPASPTCYLFNVHIESGPGVGTGFGTYATIDANSTFTGRINCHYGNETQTGTCGWGYELASPGGEWGIVYKVTPDPGSQVCDASTCYPGVVDGLRSITGNYLEAGWHFELVSHVQIDAEVKGTGSGTVTSDPPGIDCPDDCDDLFAANLPVTLTAKPAAGSVFAGWSGACTGTNKVCEVTTDFLVTATATFNRKATPPPATEPPDEETEPAPTEEVTPGPPTPAPTAEPTPGSTPPPSLDTTVGSGAQPSPTADPSASGASGGGGGNLPIVIGLALLLVMLAGGAIFAFRRGGGLGGA